MLRPAVGLIETNRVNGETRRIVEIADQAELLCLGDRLTDVGIELFALPPAEPERGH